MDSETLKALGTGSAQFVLAAGYLPVLWLVRALWLERSALVEKFMAMLAQQYADAAQRKELWEAQARVIEGQTRSITDMTREIATLREDVRRLKP